MSKTGNHRVNLQERPEYQDGYEAAEARSRRDFNPWPIGSVECTAFQLGWDDYHAQEREP